MQPSTNHKVPYSDCLIQLFNTLDFINIWRLRHPFTNCYTRREKTRFGVKQTRTDFFIISCHIEYETHAVDILPSIKSDHNLLKYAFELECEQKRGKGLLKLNTSLLLDSDFISLINKTITHAKDDFVNLANKNLAWDYLKCRIHTESITYAIHKKKVENKHLSELTKSLAYLEANIPSSPDNSYFNQISKVKGEIEEI